MDLPGRSRRLRALLDGPGTDFRFSRRQEGDQVQQAVRRLDQLVQTGLFDPQFLQEHSFFLVIQLRQLCLQLCADHCHLGVFTGGEFLHFLHQSVVFSVRRILFRHVGRVDHRLIGQEAQGFHEFCLVLRQVHRPGGQALLQDGFDFIQNIQFLLEALVSLQVLCGLLDPAVDQLDVGNDQLQVDGLDVLQRPDLSVHMHHVLVFKAPHHVDDGVHFPDVGQELVSQTLALGSAFHQTGNVHEFDAGVDDLLRVIHIVQDLQPFIRYLYHPNVGVDGAEGIILRLGTCLGNRVKKGALPHIGKADHT